MSAARSPRAIVLFLVPWLTACSTWSAVQGPPGEFVARESPEQVRVVRNDGSVVPLREPEVRGDSLAGSYQPRPSSATSDIAIPLEDVRELRTRRTDALRTALMVTGVAALVFLAAALVYQSELEDDLFQLQLAR